MNLKNAILDGISTRKDGSMKIVLITRSLDPAQMAEILMNLNQEIVSIDIPDDTTDDKTPSQRLRGVLYKLWEQQGKDNFQTFTLFYNHMLERIIDHYKDKLN